MLSICLEEKARKKFVLLKNIKHTQTQNLKNLRAYDQQHIRVKENVLCVP